LFRSHVALARCHLRIDEERFRTEDLLLLGRGGVRRIFDRPRRGPEVCIGRSIYFERPRSLRRSSSWVVAFGIWEPLLRPQETRRDCGTGRVIGKEVGDDPFDCRADMSVRVLTRSATPGTRIFTGEQGAPALAGRSTGTVCRMAPVGAGDVAGESFACGDDPPHAKPNRPIRRNQPVCSAMNSSLS
jgi:hypothetical protein